MYGYGCQQVQGTLELKRIHRRLTYSKDSADCVLVVDRIDKDEDDDGGG
jgi:hypothetical protein